LWGGNQLSDSFHERPLRAPAESPTIIICHNGSVTTTVTVTDLLRLNIRHRGKCYVTVLPITNRHYPALSCWTSGGNALSRPPIHRRTITLFRWTWVRCCERRGYAVHSPPQHNLLARTDQGPCRSRCIQSASPSFHLGWSLRPPAHPRRRTVAIFFRCSII